MFVVECRYQEAEAEIRKLPKGLKVGRKGGREGGKERGREQGESESWFCFPLQQFQLSKEVQQDEVYFFQQEIHPMKVSCCILQLSSFRTSFPPFLPFSPPPPPPPPRCLHRSC